jgi:UDP-N-acetylglucosamine 2-epimerase (non-hydrolysing)
LKVLFIFGTRPEAIKLAPLILAIKDDPIFITKVCITAQHRQMLDQVLRFFEIEVDYDLNIMQDNQTLFDISARSLKLLESVLTEFNPNLIFVQGDTTTAFVGALAGYYKKISIAHVEAGLRSGDLFSPFPEEGNRKLISQIASYHFAPTPLSAENLFREGTKKQVHIVGNTVVDALFLGLKILKGQDVRDIENTFQGIDFSKKIILVTGHRRESFGEPFLNICNAIREIATRFNQEVQIVYPVHFNPNVRKPVNEILSDLENVHLLEPLSYQYLIWIMNKSYLVLTDSGGIQEEAPSLGKPVLVMRDVTERTEGIEAGTAKLVGSNTATIVESITTLLLNPAEYQKMSKAANPYGDGKTSERILKIVKEHE